MRRTDTAGVGAGVRIEYRRAKPFEQASNAQTLAILYEFTWATSVPDGDTGRRSRLRNRYALVWNCRLDLGRADHALRVGGPGTRVKTRFATRPAHELIPDEVEDGTSFPARWGRAEKPSPGSTAEQGGERPADAERLQFMLELRVNVRNGQSCLRHLERACPHLTTEPWPAVQGL